jgi:tetratricopeptide (TPR) repeat protein
VGPFRLEAELGRGGMGVVFRATDLRADRSVALKVVLQADAGVSTQRFVREAQVVAALKHPGIVGVHDAALLEGVPCIVYELVEGGRTLETAFRSLTLAERLELVLEVADALAYVHAAGLVHRDVKPSNVLVDAEGRARLTDFGLVGGAGLERLTLTGRILGTPAYMSPEQFAAERDALGPHSDVWSLGVVLYEALTQRLPFVGDTAAEFMIRARQSTPTPPSSISPEPLPPGAEAVCLRAIAKAPLQRYADAGAFRQELASVLDGSYQRPSSWWWAASVVASALVLVAGLGAAWLAEERPEAQPSASSTSAETTPARQARSAEEWTRLGRRSAREGRRQEGLRAFDDALRVDPQHVRALLSRGAVHQDLSNLEAAVRDLQAVLRLEPEHVEAYYRLAVAEWSQEQAWRRQPDLQREASGAIELFYRATTRRFAGDLAGAQADYTRTIEANPDFHPAYNNRALARSEQGDFQGGLADLNRAMELHASDTYRMNRADVLLRLNRFSEALPDLEAVLSAAPDHVNALLRRSTARSQLKDYQGAHADVDRVQEIDPDSIPALAQRAIIREAQGDDLAAGVIYERVLALDPKHMLALNNLSVLYVRRHNFRRAETLVRRILTVLPHQPVALSNLATILLATNRLGEAVEVARRAADLAPEQPTPRLLLVRLLFRLGRYDQALDQIKRVLRAHPKSSGAYMWRAQVLAQRNEWGPAFEAAKHAIALDENAMEPRLTLGLLLIKAKRYPEAIRALTSLIDAHPDQAWAFAYRGRARADLGDKAAALADLGRALELQPLLKEALNDRATILGKLGRASEALRDLDRLLKLAPQQANYWYLRGETRFRLRHFQAALKDARHYRGLVPQDLTGALLEGRCWLELGFTIQGDACISLVLARQPKNLLALSCKVEILRRRGKWEALVRMADRVLALIDPASPPAQQFLRARAEAQARVR